MDRSLRAVLLCTTLASAPPLAAATFTVTTTADAGPGSLRQAIIDANALPGLDNIHFNIAPGGPQIISLASALPSVTDTVIIDGTTQPGFAGTPIVTIDANGVAGDVLRLDTPARSTVRGLVIVDGTGAAIAVHGAGATIVGNYLGVDASGLVADGNGIGVYLDPTSDGNIIGGTAAADRNVISGNEDEGILMAGTAGVGASDENVVQGNIIGLDATASNALRNFTGVSVDGGDRNLIGGTVPGSGNIISGNSSGIRIASLALAADVATGNMVQGNLIGTNGAGNSALPNSLGIVLHGARGTTIGGSIPGARNTISGNRDYGIWLTVRFFEVPSEDNVIEGNFIGTDSSGTADVGNRSDGVRLWGAIDNTVQNNVISGNGRGVGFQNALAPDTTGNVVRANRIGTDVTGTAALPNDNAGVHFLMSNPGLTDNTIGGTAASDGNTIRFNGGDGITVEGPGDGNGNRFLGNSIDLNGQLGIDLGNDGVTPNDPGDTDAGANDRQNYPLLTTAGVGAVTIVTGTLNSTPARTFRVEFFGSPAADPSGFGEGRTFLGFINVTTDAAGNAAIAATLPAVVTGSVVTATATDLTTSDTSEFSNAIVAIVATPSLGIGDTSIVEPDWGTENAIFTVTLTTPAPSVVTFQYATGDGTATTPADYTATAGTGVIPAGSMTTTITVPIVGDTAVEPDETFVLNITNVTGAVATDTHGQATILNDDAAAIPTLSEWTLLMMALLLAAGGAVVMRR